MTWSLWVAFVGTSTVLLIIPGPTILTVISYSIAHGRRANVPLIVGVALGDSTALFLALLGLGALLATSAFWFTVIKWAGGLYLIWLGVKMLMAGGGTPLKGGEVALHSRWRLFANTWLVTALNPKGMIFFIAFLPQFVQPDGNVTWQLTLLGVTFVVLATTNATLYALFAGSARRWFASPRAMRVFNRIGGSLLSGAGVWALLARRPV